MVKVNVNREKCIGCGACNELCPKIFEMFEGKSRPKKKEIKKDEEIKCAKQAAENCPASAISLL